MGRFRHVEPMKNSLCQQAIKILRQNPEDKLSTRRHRQEALIQIAQELREEFGLQNLYSMKQKHALHLVRWFGQNDAGRGNLNNKMTHLRWLLDNLGKSWLLGTNRELGIRPKLRYTRQGKILPAEKVLELLGNLSSA